MFPDNALVKATVLVTGFNCPVIVTPLPDVDSAIVSAFTAPDAEAIVSVPPACGRHDQHVGREPDLAAADSDLGSATPALGVERQW